MVGSRLDIHQLHIHVRTLQTDITSGLVIGNLIIEGGKLRDFDEVPEPLLHDNLPSDINLIVAAFLRKDSGPSIKAVDVLMGQSIWTQILEQQIKLGKAIANGGTTEESSTKVTTGTLLDSTDGVLKIPGSLAALGVTKTSNTAVSRGKSKVLESLTLIDEDMVYTHRLEVYHVISTTGQLPV